MTSAEASPRVGDQVGFTHEGSEMHGKVIAVDDDCDVWPWLVQVAGGRCVWTGRSNEPFPMEGP